MTDKTVFPGHKKGNQYAAMLGDLYNEAPKAVLAAIAVSFAVILDGEERHERAANAVLSEWWTLYDAGVIAQKPPRANPRDNQ